MQPRQKREMWQKVLFGTVLAAFLGYVAWVACLSPARHQIEWDVATRVSTVLERTGFPAIVPIIEGRDVELHGRVPSEAEAQRAERVASTLWGVRDVRSNLIIDDDEGTSSLAGGGI